MRTKPVIDLFGELKKNMRNQLIVVGFVCLMLAHYRETNGSVIIDSGIHDEFIELGKCTIAVHEVFQSKCIFFFSLTELKTCKKYVITSDYTHLSYNNASVENFLNIKNREYRDEIQFDVFIRGYQDARILLMEKNSLATNLRRYEIGK